MNKILNFLHKYETQIISTGIATAVIIGWELWISILAALSAIGGDDPNWYLNLSLIYHINKLF